MTKINTTTNRLWAAYAGSAQSGRFPCPIRIFSYGCDVEVTHIYRGYGQIRLERIDGSPRQRKGFQGEDVTPRDTSFLIYD